MITEINYDYIVMALAFVPAVITYIKVKAYINKPRVRIIDVPVTVVKKDYGALRAEHAKIYHKNDTYNTMDVMFKRED